MKNLRNSFPEKSHEEIKQIAKDSYLHFGDKVMEIIKTLSLPPGKALKRVKMLNPEILDEHYKNKKNLVLVSGHYTNWDWGGIAAAQIKHNLVALYKPSNNPVFDKIINKVRSKFGTIIVSNNLILRYLSTHKNEPSMYWFLADQRPLRRDIKYWTTMLNQDTPLFLGPEKIAVKMNCPVYYYKQRKMKRGYYEVELVPVAEDPKNTKEFEITENHTRILEEHILEDPALYTWTHNKWKHKKLD